jgi:hypothetical protein
MQSMSNFDKILISKCSILQQLCHSFRELQISFALILHGVYFAVLLDFTLGIFASQIKSHLLLERLGI